MGYFSNGTESSMYEEEYCSSCAHYKGGCAVLDAHMLKNYDECNNKESILHMLIPLSKDGLSNEKCRMYLFAGQRRK